MPQPSALQELHDFYAAVKRIADYWGGRLTVDGKRMHIDEFMAGFDDMVQFNDRLIKHISQEVFNGEHETLMLHSAMWPLAMGKEEAAAFLDDSGRYSAWLHEKQSQLCVMQVLVFTETIKEFLLNMFLQAERHIFSLRSRGFLWVSWTRIQERR